MKVERFPYGYDVLNRFPNARHFKGWESGFGVKALHLTALPTGKWG